MITSVMSLKMYLILLMFIAFTILKSDTHRIKKGKY